ncbi:MAG TPA: 3-hydroxyacyl-CoA dehydrogenase NAD-binding domain-containing protein [Vicinamibacteria bacterium]|jgi:3-hydroxybutyryl-CoA dehydrogenase
MGVSAVAVIGSGLMGRGIAYVAAAGGFQTTLHDVSADALERAVGQIRRDLDEGIKRGKLTAEAAAEALKRLRPEQELDTAATQADFVIEAVPEDLPLKVRTFARLDELCREGVVLASNTSALSITDIASACRGRDRVIGMHFFNPVPKMKLVEVVRSKHTSEAAVSATRAVAARMGKETVLVNEAPGFVTSRMNALIGNEAFLMLEQGVASAEDIDKAVKLGLNHPMGPFEMVDLVGLDTRLAVLQTLQRHLGDKYKPAALLERYVREGRLGKKAGRGVFTYDEK